MELGYRGGVIVIEVEVEEREGKEVVEADERWK